MLIFYLIALILLASGFGVYIFYIKPKQDPLYKAKELASLNKYSEAITEYKRILSSNPDSPEIHYKTAELFIKMENYEQAVFHLNEILRIDKYGLEVKKINILKSLAMMYLYTEDEEKAFQLFFDILKIDSEDPDAYYHISFIALGQECFDIAQPYFERLVKVRDDFESFFGAGICSYQNKKNEDAINYFKEALSLKAASDVACLALSFALQRNGKFGEALSYLNKLLGRVAEDSVVFIAKRLMAFLYFESGKNKEGLGIMEEILDFAREKDMKDEINLSLYDVGFACIENELLERAYNYWDELNFIDSSYENIKVLLNQLKKDMNKQPNDGFDSSIYDRIDDWKQNAFSQEFLWNICGLKSSKVIDVRNVIVPAKMPKSKESSKKDSGINVDASAGERVNKFCSLDAESFRMISGRLVIKLGNKIEEQLHTYRESDGVDILSKSQDNSEKVLIWIRRWKGTMIGEITLRNFAQAVNDIKAQKGILITTAELTQAAENNLSKLNRIRVIYPQDLEDLLKGLI